MNTPLFLLALLVVVGMHAGADEVPLADGYKIATQKADDTVTVSGDPARTVFAVKSPSGIGQATVERKGDVWPKTVALRLHLSGLESLRLANANGSLDAAVSVQDGKPSVRLWKDGKEDMPLDAKSPFWMNIAILTRDGTPTASLPLKDGHFEMTLPAAFFANNPPAVTLKWIDYFR